VENAVRHGVTPQIEGGAIRVEAKVEDGRLAVAVTDDGPGFPDAPTPDDRPHVGLDNVRNRLRLCYGSAAGLTVESARGRTVVAFRVPLSGPAAEGR
jgi:sensor histidine kinase YesM